jgi:uncharacterized alkaline shock family protein YloU
VTDDADVLPPPEDRGRLVIHDGVVETIARRAAATVSHSHRVTGLSRVIDGDLPRARVEISAGRVQANLVVAAPWPTPVSTLARRVQEVVTQHIGDQTGLTVVRVDVDVHCISPDDPATNRRVQ